MKGFFPLSDMMAKRPVASLVPRCGACGLYKGCLSPKMPPSGKGRYRVLIVGEAPGRNEDEEGVPFVGKTGKYLEEVLDSIDVDLRKDCWLTNALICRPPDNKIEKASFIDHCRPNLVKTIRDLDPEVIIPLGTKAVRSLIGWLWKSDPKGIERWLGWRIPCQKLNAWICPTWHPSHLLRDGGVDEEKMHPRLIEVREEMWRGHLEAAFGLSGRPWKKVPEYEPRVRRIVSPTEAAAAVREFMRAGRPVAVDYETASLKPDRPDRWLVCASVSDGGRAIAFPWEGEAVRAMGELLLSDVPKWGHNIKFEDRWTRKLLGHGVNNWQHDSMLSAHILDNRRGVTGLKFQAFARLGAESYNDVVEPFLKSKDGGGNSTNRIREVNQDKLMLYCGMDSLLEYHLAKLQRKEMGLS